MSQTAILARIFGECFGDVKRQQRLFSTNRNEVQTEMKHKLKHKLKRSTDWNDMQAEMKVQAKY